MKVRSKNNNFVATLTQLCSGLKFISEIDAEIIPFEADEDIARRLANHPNDGDDEKIIDKFFDKLTTPQAWHRKEQKERAAQYLNLESFLRQNLTSLRVIRIGKVQVEIYVVGTTATGSIAGIKTHAVET